MWKEIIVKGILHLIGGNMSILRWGRILEVDIRKYTRTFSRGGFSIFLGKRKNVLDFDYADGLSILDEFVSKMN